MSTMSRRLPHLAAALLFTAASAACGGPDTQPQGGECCDRIHSSRDPMPGCDTYPDPTPTPQNNVTVTLQNTTANVQQFQPTGRVADGDTGKTTATWNPGTIAVDPGQTKTFVNVMYAPIGSRVSLDVWLLTADPDIRSGRGYSVTVTHETETCSTWTTGMEPPNGVGASCS